MRYTELQKCLSHLKSEGKDVTCKLTSTREVLETEYQRLTDGLAILPADDISLIKVDDKETSIKVLEVDDTNNTITTSIGGESHVVEVYWDNERDTAISVNREVIVSSRDACWEEAKSSDICKIEYIGDIKGNYRAFPLSTVQGYSKWLYPSENTVYHTIKARISIHDTVSKSIVVSRDNQKPTVVTSDDICIVRMIDDVRCGISRYFPAIATFELIGSKWQLFDSRSENVRWISVVQSAREHSFKVGTMVYLQGDIGRKGKLDIYRIDKLFYTHLCLMAYCVNQSNGTTEIVPIVQLHLPQTLR